MNLTKLFEMQQVLDERIVKEKGLEGQDLLPQKILALQVELGECANEWRGFKYWSKDQQPRTSIHVIPGTEGFADHKNPLLEEYIDCLHFILSIGNAAFYDISFMDEHVAKSAPYQSEFIQAQFTRIFGAIVNFERYDTRETYTELFDNFFGLGRMFGFTWEQIEEAYMSKNQTNHKRQDTGY